jgi:hypothetical protein
MSPSEKLAMLLSTETRSSTMESWKSHHINDPYFSEKLLILNSAATPFASKWLHELPNSGLRQTMSNAEFNAICSFQLLF